MDLRLDPSPDLTRGGDPAPQRARQRRQTRQTHALQEPHPSAISTGAALNPGDPQNLTLIPENTIPQQPSEAAKRFTPTTCIPQTSAAPATLNPQGLESSSETNTQQQQPSASRLCFLGTLYTKIQSYLRDLQATVKAHYEALVIAAQLSPPLSPRGHMPGTWHEDHIYTQDSATANQTLNTHSGQSGDGSMGTSASQSASEFPGRQDAQISLEEQSTTPRPSVIDGTSLAPISNVAGVSAAPQPDQLGPPTDDTQSTLERDWSRIVNAARVFAKKPTAPRQAASTAAEFIDSIDTAPEDKHTLPTFGAEEQFGGAALSGQGTAVAKPEQHIQDQHPLNLQLPGKYKEQKAAQEPPQRDNKSNSILHNRPDAPTVRSSGQQQKGHSVVTSGHQKRVSKPHLSSTEGKPISKLPHPVKQSNENMKGPNLCPQKHSAMLDRPCGSTTAVLEEQATNSGATQTMVSKQTQGAGNAGTRTSEGPQTHGAQGNVPQQPRRNNNRLLDPRSLHSGAPVPDIRNSKAQFPALPDLGPPPPLPVPIKFQAGKDNETLGTPVIPPSSALAKPHPRLPTQVPIPGRSGPPPGTVTAGTQAVISTQTRLKSLTTDRKSLVTVSAEFNPRLEASSIPKAPAFTPETGVKEHNMDSEKIKQNYQSSATPPLPFVPRELSSDVETSFKELALTQHDWEEIEAQGRAQGNLTEQDLKWIKIFNKLQEKSNPPTGHAHDADSDQPGTNVKVGQGAGGDEKKKTKKARKKGKKNRQNGKPESDIKVYPNPTFQFGKAGPAGGVDQGISPAECILLPRNCPEVRSEYLREIAAARPTLQTYTQPPAPIPRIRTLNPNPVIMVPSSYNTALPPTSMAIPFTNSSQSPMPMEMAPCASELKLHSFPPFPEPVMSLGVEDRRQTSKATAPHLTPPPRGGPSTGTETKPSTSQPPLPSKGRTASLQAAQLPGQSNLPVPPVPPIPGRFRVTDVAKPVAAVQSGVENISSKHEAPPEERMARYIIASLERELLQDQVEAQYVTRLKQLASSRPLKTVADGNAFKGYIKKYIEAYITSRIVRIFHEFQGQSFLTEKLKNELQGMANRAIPMRQNESERLVEQFLNTFVVLIPTAPNSAFVNQISTQQRSVQAPQKEAKKSAFTENIDSKLKTTPESEANSRPTTVRGTPGLSAKSASSTSTRGAPAFKFTAGNTPGNKPTHMATVPVHQDTLKNQESKGKQPAQRNQSDPVRPGWGLDTSDDEPLENVTKELQGPREGGSRYSLRSKEEMAQFGKGLAYRPKVRVIEKKQVAPQITGMAGITFQRPDPHTCVQRVQNIYSALKPPFFKKEEKDEWAYKRMYSDEYFRILNKMNPEAQEKPDEKAAFEKVRLGKRKAEAKDSGCGVAWCTGCQACPGRNVSSTSHSRGQTLISMSNGDTILVETSVDNWKDTEAFTLNPVSGSTSKGLRRGRMPFKPFKGGDRAGYGFGHSTQTRGGRCKGEYGGSDDGEELSSEKEEELVNSTLAEMEKGIRAKQEDLMVELEKFKTEQEKTMAALTGLGIGQAPPCKENVLGADPSHENALGAGPANDKSGGKKKNKKKKGKGKGKGKK